MLGNKKTVIITGAGASIPYGLPSTADLRRDIVQNSRSRFRNWQTAWKFRADLADRMGDIADVSLVRRFIDEFNKSHAESIDQFLANRAGDFLSIGKACLAASIAYFQWNARASMMHDGNWLQYLMGRMSDGCKTVDEFQSGDQNNVAFITFNYDRIIEQFIANVMRYRFGDKSASLADFSALPFPVYHVYGAINAPSPEAEYQNEDIRHQHFTQLIAESIDGIRIIGEERTGKYEFHEKLTQVICEASHVIVIGFGWHPDNIHQIPWRHIGDWAKVDIGMYGVPRPVWDRAVQVLGKQHFKRNQYYSSDQLVGMMRDDEGNVPMILHDADALSLLRENVGLLV